MVYIYTLILSVHHEFPAPFGICSIYTHPIEEAIASLSSTIGPYLVSRHLFTVWIWYILRIVKASNAHSGYVFSICPWTSLTQYFILRYRLAIDLTNCFPFATGHTFHDYHHMAFEGNFASTFVIWDYLCGTDKSFRQLQLEKQQQGKPYWHDILSYIQSRKAKHI